MDNLPKEDNLNYTSDKNILKIINNETIYYSGNIIKVNDKEKSQERVLLITDKAIYNIKKKELKRRFELNNIIGITISPSTNEFVIHGGEAEYDYHYLSKDKLFLIVYLITKLAEQNYKNFIKLMEIEGKSIKNYITNKVEKKKNPKLTKMDEKLLIPFSNISSKFGDSDKKRTNTLFSKHKSIQTVNIEDFKVLKVLGRGSYGKVTLVQHLPTNEYYAMKSLRKDVLLDNDQVQSTIIEKKILENLNYPFLVGMVWCFQTQERIFFVMPFIQGGELFQLLKSLKKFDENQVKFYAAIIGMSLHYLHNNGIIYRDIKPENILLENDGYLKLVDFGLAKYLKKNERTMSFCGTPEYVAPEIISGEGHDANADWWSYGILIYEMLFGIPPFFNDNNEKMFELILNSEVRFPKKIKVSDEAKDFICKLLVKDEDKRLGAKDGFDEIKLHPFFKDINFDDLLEKKIKAPFTPTVNGELDIHNFDKEFTNEEITDSIIPEKNLDYIKRNQAQFDEFNS